MKSKEVEQKTSLRNVVDEEELLDEDPFASFEGLISSEDF